MTGAPLVRANKIGSWVDGQRGCRQELGLAENMGASLEGLGRWV